jgi:TolB protein
MIASNASSLAGRLWRRTVVGGVSVLFMAALGSQAAHAQLRVDISGVGATQYPIAIADFAGTSGGTSVGEVIRADLTRSGQFRLINATGANLDIQSTISYEDWQSRGADYLAYGSITQSGGQYSVSYRLVDSVRKAELDQVTINGTEAEMRRISHQIADRIYEKITGVRGVFSTRIAYVLHTSNGYELQIADADGQNPQVMLRSKHSIISPSWSPDGSKLAIVLSRDSISQIYTVNADGSDLRRVMRSPLIDTEPQFTADGQSLVFTSDRGGNPQIYKVPVSGGDAQRLTFSGGYNISPRPSPDGSQLVYVTRRNGAFRIASLDMNSGSEQLLTTGPDDQSPSFAPNGMQVLYSSVQGGRSVLAVTSTDGRVKQTLSALNGQVREPTWGPFAN